MNKNDDSQSGTQFLSNLSSYAFNTETLPSHEEAKKILALEKIDTEKLKTWANDQLRSARARQKLAGEEGGEIMCAMSYKDMTFCQESSCAKFGKDCFRSLTPEMEDAAKRWWGSDEAPVSVFTSRPDCYEEGEICRKPLDKRKSVL